MSTENDLEKEGEIAADFIEEFLDLADLDGDLELKAFFWAAAAAPFVM